MDLTGMIVSFVSSETFTLVVLPILIFLARIVDMSLETVRVIFVIRGYKYISALIGFVEIFIWLLAITQIMKNLTNLANYVAYAGGFASGTFIGMCIEERLAMGNVLIRIVTKRGYLNLAKSMEEEGYEATVLDAKEGGGPSKIILSAVKRRDLKEIINIIKENSPDAFYSVEDLRTVSGGIFRGKTPSKNYLIRIRRKRK